MCICKIGLGLLGAFLLAGLVTLVARSNKRAPTIRQQSGSDFAYVRKQIKTPGEDRAFAQRIRGLFPELRYFQ